MAVVVIFAGQVIEGAVGSTVVVAILLLLSGTGSIKSELAVAVLLMRVPCRTPLFTLTTTWKVAVSLLATEAFENITDPMPPTAGRLGVHPVPLVTIADTNVVLAGTTSVILVLRPGPRPLFNNPIV